MKIREVYTLAVFKEQIRSHAMRIMGFCLGVCVPGVPGFGVRDISWHALLWELQKISYLEILL